MTLQKPRTDEAEFLAECIHLNPALKSLPIVQKDLAEKYAEGAYDILSLVERASILGSTTANRKLEVAQELMNDLVEVLRSVVDNLGQVDDPQVQGLVSGLEEYLDSIGG